MRILKRLFVLLVLVLCFVWISTVDTVKVSANSCMQECSDFCSAQLSSCYEFCGGCPYYEGAFFRWWGVPGSGDVNCTETCFTDCSANHSQCGVQCGYACGFPLEDPN